MIYLCAYTLPVKRLIERAKLLARNWLLPLGSHDFIADIQSQIHQSVQDDFNGFLWNVVMLAMGGLALGEAVTSSGLLLTIAKGVSEAVNGVNNWLVLVIFCLLVLVATTFISHTVGAMVILPIVQTVGAQLPVRCSISVPSRSSST